jgi:gas vesicle protein
MNELVIAGFVGGLVGAVIVVFVLLLFRWRRSSSVTREPLRDFTTQQDATTRQTINTTREISDTGDLRIGKTVIQAPSSMTDEEIGQLLDIAKDALDDLDLSELK